jgi:hypothetical protein
MSQTGGHTCVILYRRTTVPALKSKDRGYTTCAKRKCNPMNAQTYFTDIVLPTYAEFENNPTCKRRAMLATLVLFHLLDYQIADARENKGHLGNLKKKVCGECVAFGAIAAIATGVKHVEIKGPDKFSPEEIETLPAGTIVERFQHESQVRVFKTPKPMLWFEYKKQRHFLYIDLYVSLQYLATAFELSGAEEMQLPLQLCYSTSA